MAVSSFPPIELADSNGLLAIGGDFDVSTLLLAYKNGIFPWPISPNYPLAWFSPDPRGVLFIDNLHVPKSLNRLISKNQYQVKINTNFENVIIECAKSKNRKSNSDTWITDALLHGYIDLFQAGHAYSLEIYNLDEKLIGGIYGVVINHFVSGESMFFLESNASKIALVSLLNFLHQKGVKWIDTQMVTPVISNFGGTEIPRSTFIRLLKKALLKTSPIF